METRTIVVAVVEKKDQILFGRKEKDRGPYPNKWLVLGGGVEKNETYEEALHREVKEEANIEIEIIEKMCIDEDIEPNKHGIPTKYTFHTYKCKYISGEVKAGDDMAILQWIDKDKIKDLDMCKPSKKLFLNS